MSGVKQDPLTTKKDAIHSQAKVIGLLADGYRLLLICNHLLDNTKQPKAEDYAVCVDGVELPVKAAFLASPMLSNSSWAAITLLLGKMVPKNSELKVEYKQAFNTGLLSLVDRKRLAPLCVSAWSNQKGALTLHDGSDPAPVQQPQKAMTIPGRVPSQVDIAPLNALRHRLNDKDAVIVQEELFFDYVSSMFDGEEYKPTSEVFNKIRLKEEVIPTLTLVAPNPERPLPVKVARIETSIDVSIDSSASTRTESADLNSADGAQLAGKAREKREPEKQRLLQSLLNSTTGLMLGRGALIRSK